MPAFFDIFIPLLCLGGLMMVLLETGRRIGKRRMLLDPRGSHEGLGATEAAVFGLMGLMIAFTFSGASDRFDHRRKLIIEEANAIEAAYRRIDLVPADAQPAIRLYFREYLEARIEVYKGMNDLNVTSSTGKKGEVLLDKIWTASIEACKRSDNVAASIVFLPALNSMIDTRNTRLAYTQLHQPNIIFVVLALLALICSVLAGYAMAPGTSRNWIYFTGFTVVMVVCIYVIIDMEYPRMGIIRVDTMDFVIIHLRDLMK